MNNIKCFITGKKLDKRDAVPASSIRRNLTDFIRTEHPDFDDNAYLSHEALQQYRRKYLQSIIEKEAGEAVKVEAEVVDSIIKQELTTTTPDNDDQSSFGQKLADKVADFGGSWTFILSFSTILLIWIFVNTFVLANKGFDPYPYILLNLVLSCLAALQAPVIMMSQNRQEAKDRERNEYDYKVNLKAELEIRMLHEKLDHLMVTQMQKIMEFQQMQMDSMEELSQRLDNHIKNDKKKL